MPESYQGLERRGSDRNLNEHAQKVVEVQLEVRAMSADVAEIKTDIRLLTQSLQKLVIVEERQGVMMAAQERMFGVLGEHDKRLRVFETAAPEATKVGQFADKVLWGAVVLVAMFMFKKMGLA